MHLKWLTISHSSKLTRSYFQLNHRHNFPSVDLNYQFLSQARQSIVAFNTNHIIAICHDISVTDKPDNINKMSISTLH